LGKATLANILFIMPMELLTASIYFYRLLSTFLPYLVNIIKLTLKSNIVIRIFRFFFAANHGQALQDAVEKANECLRQKGVVVSEYLPRRQRTRLAALRERLANAVPVRPRDAFALNTSMTLSACGTVTTYIIVLLQFKASDI
jgi:hypothetical protein